MPNAGVVPKSNLVLVQAKRRTKDAIRRRAAACTPTTREFMQLGDLMGEAKGANSTVYDGFLLSNKDPVVCKSWFCCTSDEVQEFFGEARATARAQSPFVPRLISLSTGVGRSNIVMAKASCDLSNCLDTYSNEFSAKIALLQILRIVQMLHRRGILHLDVSPKNVLVVAKDAGDNSALMLADFGASVLLSNDGSVEWESTTIVTELLPPECQTPIGGEAKMAKNEMCDAFACVQLFFGLVANWTLFVDETSAVEGEIPELHRTMPIDCPSELRHALAAADFDPSFSQEGREFIVASAGTNDPSKRWGVNKMINSAYLSEPHLVKCVDTIWNSHKSMSRSDDYNLYESHALPPITMAARAGFTIRDIHELEHRFAIVPDAAMPPFDRSYKTPTGEIDSEKLARVNQQAHWTNLVDAVRETQKVQREMSGKLETMNNTINTLTGVSGVPGDILTQPDKKIVVNAPFSEKNVYNVRLTNNGAHRIGWAIKTTNMKRIAVDPPCGMLDSKESIMLTIVCEPFDFVSEDTNLDRILFKWKNAPEGFGRQFHREWFKGDGIVRRKNLPIEYNA